MKKSLIIPSLLLIIGCNNSQNQKNITPENQEVVVNNDSTKESLPKEENLSEEEKNVRSLIEKKLKEELVDFESSYEPIEYGAIEEYYLSWIGPYELQRLAQARAQGQSLDVARARMEESTINHFKRFGTRNQDTRKGLRSSHTFKHKKDGGIKTSTLMFYFDKNLSNILYIEKTNNITMPEL